MARQKGVFKFTGTVDGVTFYNSKYGPLVRKKAGPSGRQLKNDPAFEAAREHGKEFGACSKCTKLLRAVLQPLLREASDFKVTGRLNKLMHAVKNLDKTSPRGERSVAVGIALPAAKDLVTGFDFNEKAPLSELLKKPITVDSTTGIISIRGLVPAEDIVSPAGATHAKLTGGQARFDFAAGDGELVISDELFLHLNGTATDVRIAPTSQPSGTGTDIFVLQIVFYQEINGVQYALKNGEGNGMGVVGLSQDVEGNND